MERQSPFYHLVPKNSKSSLFATLFLGLALAGCGGGGGNNATSGDHTRNQLQGVGQKGPLVAGSTVVAYRLNADGSRTGDTVTGQTTDDKGNFSVLLAWTGATELEATGQYLDETTCTPSVQNITLQGIMDSTGTGGKNLNLFSALVAARVKTRMAAGDTFTTASTTAHQDLKTLLDAGLHSTDVSTLDITDGSSSQAEDNAQLLLFSAALIKAGAANFATLQTDFADDGLANGAAANIWKNIQTAASTPNLLADASACLESEGLTNDAPNVEDLPDEELPSWVNQAPVATTGITATTNEDTATDITLSGTDADGDTLTYSIVAAPINGTLGTVGADGKVTYTPAADFNGSDSFTFKANDSSVDSAPATVNLTVTAVDDDPVVANPISDVSVNEDAANSTLNLGSVFSDIDGDGLTLSIQNNTNATLVTPTLSSNTLTLAYATNGNGLADITIRATANGKTVDETFTVTVTGVNDMPVASTGITATTDEDTATDITLSGTDADGDTLTYSIVAAPTNGTLGTVGADGKVTYTPAADFNGSDSFTFKANDGSADSASATVNITINPVDDGPTATPGNASTNEDTAVEIMLAGSSPSGGTLTYSIVAAPTNGTLGTVGADGKVIYTPTADFNGSDSFTFKVNNTVADSAPATISLTVNAVNDTPIAEDAIVPTNKNSPVNITLSGTDVDSTSLTYTIVSSPTHGTLSGSGDSRTYTPATDYVGDDSFTFTVSDGSLTSATATVSIAVFQALNDTGITACGDETQNGLACPQATHPGQDGDSGRDFTTNDDSDGHAGLSFTKLGADGTALAIQSDTWSEAGTEAAGTHWSCVKDNVTGLVWEMKTDDGGAHDKDNAYTWYNSDATTNGGNAGREDSDNVCAGYSAGNTATYCNTTAFAARVNTERLCGFDDWRVPTMEELRSMVDYAATTAPRIDLSFFPNTGNYPFWSSQTVPNNAANALRVQFDTGADLNSGSKTWNNMHLRLVRGTLTY